MSSDSSVLLNGLLSRMNHAVLRRVSDEDASGHAFELVADAPDWFAEVFGSAGEAAARSVFLGDFIDHLAAEHWDGNVAKPLHSGIWEEGDKGYFEAAAWNLDGERLLLVSSTDEKVEREQRFVQSSHDQTLDRRRIFKEIEKKEILLDCIVHDLSGPVGTLLMNLNFIGRKLGETSTLKPAVDRALNQTQRQLTMIRSISHLFANDIEASEADDDEVRDGVDMVAVAHEMVDFHRLTAKECSLQFRLVREDPSLSTRVVGRESHLSRVVENLLLNAIRHTPADGQITVTVETLAGGKEVEVRVEDTGPGVDADLAGEIFKPFTQGGGEHAGQSGLGLYFCRIVTEQYGGSIGYRERDRSDSPSGGACFWFRLPVATHPNPSSAS